MRLSGWASVQHAFAALLFGAAIIAGGAVEGGVVAYQVGWFFFLAPYGIIAQPIHTTILPELVAEHGAGDTDAFAASLRWALDSMTVLLVPLSALCLALAVPLMSVLAFGAGKRNAERRPAGRGVGIARCGAAALRGVLPARPCLLRARRLEAAGDAGGVQPRWSGVVIMVVAGATTSGTTTVVALGLAHSVSFLVGSVALVVVLPGGSGGGRSLGACPAQLPSRWWPRPARGRATRCGRRSVV